MGVRLTDGFLGSANLMTSTANQSIISDLPTNAGIRYMNFVNYQDCHITITRNSVDLKTIFLKAYQGWNMSIYDLELTAIKIQEAGIQYNYYGSYSQM